VGLGCSTAAHARVRDPKAVNEGHVRKWMVKEWQFYGNINSDIIQLLILVATTLNAGLSWPRATNTATEPAQALPAPRRGLLQRANRVVLLRDVPRSARLCSGGFSYHAFFPCRLVRRAGRRRALCHRSTSCSVACRSLSSIGTDRDLHHILPSVIFEMTALRVSQHLKAINLCVRTCRRVPAELPATA
jgi:hypothetical protein